MSREVHVRFCEGLAGKFRRSTLLFKDLVSFNPCFDGTLIASCLNLYLYDHSGSFNPCFDGTLIASDRRGFEQAGYDVSILVLMEPLSHRGKEEGLSTFVKSFNPCFDGTLIASMKAIAEGSELELFQSLF